MAIVTLKDGSLGYNYPKKPQAYKPTATPFCGKSIQLDPKDDYRFVIIREVHGSYRSDPTPRQPSGYYWVAPVLPDGTIGKMTTRYVYAESLNG